MCGPTHSILWQGPKTAIDSADCGIDTSDNGFYCSPHVAFKNNLATQPIIQHVFSCPSTCSFRILFWSAFHENSIHMANRKHNWSVLSHSLLFLYFRTLSIIRHSEIHTTIRKLEMFPPASQKFENFYPVGFLRKKWKHFQFLKDILFIIPDDWKCKKYYDKNNSKNLNYIFCIANTFQCFMRSSHVTCTHLLRRIFGT